MYLWSQDTMVKNAAETTGISQKTVVQMYQYFRDVYSTKHINSPAQLGGPGIVVQDALPPVAVICVLCRSFA
jgi:ADP-ribosylglycohydrolase